MIEGDLVANCVREIVAGREGWIGTAAHPGLIMEEHQP
jgi:hypothetical protein